MYSKYFEQLEDIRKSQKVSDTLNKLLFGYYVTDRERKYAMKDAIDLMLRDAKTKLNPYQLLKAENRAQAMKLYIENLPEANF